MWNVRLQLFLCSFLVCYLLLRSGNSIIQNVHSLTLLNYADAKRNSDLLRYVTVQWGSAISCSSSCSRSFLHIGIKQFLDGEFVTGQEALERYVNCHQDDKVAAFWLGHVYYAQGDSSAANMVWYHAGVIDYMLTMARTALEQQDLQTSFEYYDLAFGIDEGDCRVWAGYGRLLLEKNDNDAALAAYLRAKDLGCVEMDIFIEIGNIFRHKQDYDSALYWYRRAAQEYMSEPLPIVLEGIVFYRQADFESAVNSFNHALDIRESMDTYAWLGRAYLQLRQTEEAIAAYAKAVEINPRSTKYYLPLGDIYEKEGRFGDAFNLYTQGLSLDPTNEQLHERWRAISQMELNQ